MDRNLNDQMICEEHQVELTASQVSELQMHQLAMVGGGMADVVGA